MEKLGKAVITGASAGLGAIYADRPARRGFDLILVARDEARMRTLADRLKAETGVSVEILRADLTNEHDLSQIEQVLLGDAGVSLLINNAGIALDGSILENGPAELSQIVSINITAPTRLAAAAAKAFVARGSGAIVNISSVLAFAPEVFDGVYSGSKSYILNLSQAMHAQLRDKGVYVQVVLPGATRTEIWERSGKDVDKLAPGVEVMDANDLVDAALVGFDRKEGVTIPPLPDEAQWTAIQAARHAMGPNLSKRVPAERYRETQPA